MNILFVNDIPFNPIGGGIERVTDVLTKEFLKRGYTVYYLCAKLAESQLYLLDYAFPANLYQLPNYGFFNNEENIEFYKQLQSELNIDVVVNQRGLNGFFNALLPITNAKKISVIHSTPDSDIMVFLDKLIESTAPPFVGIKKILKKSFPSLISSYWKNKVASRVGAKYNELAFYSNAIVTLSEGYIDILSSFINIPHQARIVSIPNPTTFSVDDIPFESKEKIVLYVGRLEKDQKEPMRLMKIWKYLDEKYPDWQFRIVGEGGEMGNMQEYVKLHNLKNVFFEGRQSDVAQFYRKASFICLTSNFEGFPMVIMEGMQFGCIPLTFQSYAAAYDVIDDGVNGCLIPAFDLKKYVNRLSELMSDDKKRIKMSKAAIEKVQAFSVENVVDKWEGILKRM